MRALERWADRVGVLSQLGYRVIGDAEHIVIMYHRELAHYVHLDENIVTILDKFEQRGFKSGFERGAYEEMTKEDV